MSEAIEIIKERRSVRSYKDKPVSEKIISRLIACACYAPSGMNSQPWRFIVIRNPETKNKIGRLAKLGSGSRMTAWHCLGETQERFKKIEDPVKKAEVLRFMYSGEVSEFARYAPVIIAVLGTLMEGSVDVPYDLSAAVENMLIEAHSLGLGACWVHGPVASTRDAKKFKEILKIPTGMGEYKVIAYVAFGWPAEQRKHPRPKKPLEELVYWEEFGRKERPKYG